MTKPTICFVHIPKTAGSAIRASLVEMLGGWEKILWFGINGTFAKFTESPPEALRKYAIVGGHAAASGFEKLSGPKVHAAVLREPVARAVSLYEYIVRGADASHPLRPELQGMGLRRALTESAAFRQQISNVQCQMVGGEPTFAAARESLSAKPWICGTDRAPQMVLDRLARTLGKRSLPLAQDNVGAPGYFERLATPEIVEMIADLNQEDAGFYRHVASRRNGAKGRWWHRFLP